MRSDSGTWSVWSVLKRNWQTLPDSQATGHNSSYHPRRYVHSDHQDHLQSLRIYLLILTSDYFRGNRYSLMRNPHLVVYAPEARIIISA